ncbi:hypothetical protein V6380_12105 [Acinetobacter variabilis]
MKTSISFCVFSSNMSLLSENKKSFDQVQALFQQLDLASHYLLFSLVKERLPRRAKLLFAAEDYSDKKEVIEEVMQHWIKDKYSNVA